MCFVDRDKELNIRHTAFDETTNQPGRDVVKIGPESAQQEIQTGNNGWIVLTLQQTLFPIKNVLELMATIQQPPATYGYLSLN